MKENEVAIGTTVISVDVLSDIVFHLAKARDNFSKVFTSEEYPPIRVSYNSNEYVSVGGQIGQGLEFGTWAYRVLAQAADENPKYNRALDAIRTSRVDDCFARAKAVMQFPPYQSQ